MWLSTTDIESQLSRLSSGSWMFLFGWTPLDSSLCQQC